MTPVPLELPPTPEQRAAGERRAKLLRVAAGSGAAVMIVGAAVAAPLLASRSERPKPVSAPAVRAETAAPAVASPPPEDPSVLVKRGRVGRGGTLLGALQTQGLNANAAHEIIGALAGRFDPRRSRPEDAFAIRLDRASGQVRSFEYVVDASEAYDLARDAEGKLRGRRRDIEVTVVRRAV